VPGSVTRNLVIVIPDTLRTLDGVSGFSPSRDVPFIAGVAGRSVRFSGAVASGAWTFPSHASLLLGTESWRKDRAWGNGNGSGTTSIARAWAEAGGETVAFSLNPFVTNRNGILRDYDEFRDRWTNDLGTLAWQISRPVDLLLNFLGAWSLPDTNDHRKDRTPRGLAVRPLYRFTEGAAQVLCLARAPLFNSDRLLHQLSRFLRDRRSHRGLHVLINLMDAHEPYPLPRSPRTTALEAGTVPTWNLGPHSTNLSRASRAGNAAQAGYLSAVRGLDSTLANLFDLLRKHSILPDASVWIASDHGQSLGENGEYGHGQSLSDEVVRVPVFAWRPRNGSPGSEPRDIATALDHRHLHDLIVDSILAPDRPLEAGIPGVVEKRGPATSYLQVRRAVGPGPMVREPLTRYVRMWDDGSQVAAHQRVGGPSITVDSQRGDGAPSLQTAVRNLLRNANEHGDLAEVEDDVASRLTSWGYV